jgi:hypothetical protein
MGVKVFEELIDEEIVTLVNKMNMFPFLQSRSSCSGWSGLEADSTRSDGIDRRWAGVPYLSFWSLDDTSAFKFLVEVMKTMIFDHNDLNYVEFLDDYKKVLDSVGLVDDGKQLIHTNLEWRNEKVVINIYLDAKDRTPEFIEKVFKLIENIVDNYKV